MKTVEKTESLFLFGGGEGSAQMLLCGGLFIFLPSGFRIYSLEFRCDLTSVSFSSCFVNKKIQVQRTLHSIAITILGGIFNLLMTEHNPEI